MREVNGLDDLSDLVQLVEQLDEDNERLRNRVLEVLAWAEEAVDTEVRLERQLKATVERLEAQTMELEAMQQTITWRLATPLRRLYSKTRRSSQRDA